MALEARFKSAEHAARYLAAYDATLALWPVPYEGLDIPTRFGLTHVNAAGDPEAPPLVLLHGAQMSSPIWYPNVGPLSQHFRVYAPDVIDQMGRGVPTRRPKTPQDCADWLGDVLDALHIAQAAFVGHSEGGWLTLNLALRAPQRVARLALLAPAPALARLRWQMLLRMLPVFVRPTRGAFYRYFQGMTTLPLDPNQPHPMVEQFMIGAQAFNPQELSLGVTSVFTDEELGRIETPTLLLVGEREVVYAPEVVLARARRMLPHVEADLIAGGGHLFPVEQADVVNARLLAFLTA